MSNVKRGEGRGKGKCFTIYTCSCSNVFCTTFTDFRASVTELLRDVIFIYGGLPQPLCKGGGGERKGREGGRERGGAG